MEDCLDKASLVLLSDKSPTLTNAHAIKQTAIQLHVIANIANHDIAPSSHVPTVKKL
jgi:hypothetical protein